MFIFPQINFLKKDKRFLPIILILAFLVRALAGYFLQNHQLPDFFAQYGPTAEKFVAGQGFEEMRPPGFFVFLIPFVFIFRAHYIYPAILGQCLMGAGLVYILYKLALGIFKNETGARLSAIMAAFYPWLIYYSGQLSPEHWTVFWLCASLWMAVQVSPKKDLRFFFYFGLLLGFAAWARSQFTLYIGLLFCLLWILRRAKLTQLLITLLGVMIFIGSWTAYNGVCNHIWSFTGGNADHNLYLGLNERNKTGGGIWGRDAPSFEELKILKAGLTTDEYQNYYKNEVKHFVKAHPDQVLILAVKKMFIFWRPYPTAEGYTNIWTILIIAGTFIPLVILAILSVLANYQNGSIYFLILYIAQLNAIHLIFPGSLVYRFPIEPLLIVLAGESLRKVLWKKS